MGALQGRFSRRTLGWGAWAFRTRRSAAAAAAASGSASGPANTDYEAFRGAASAGPAATGKDGCRSALTSADLARGEYWPLNAIPSRTGSCSSPGCVSASHPVIRIGLYLRSFQLSIPLRGCADTETKRLLIRKRRLSSGCLLDNCANSWAECQVPAASSQTCRVGRSCGDRETHCCSAFEASERWPLCCPRNRTPREACQCEACHRTPFPPELRAPSDCSLARLTHLLPLLLEQGTFPVSAETQRGTRSPHRRESPPPNRYPQPDPANLRSAYRFGEEAAVEALRMNRNCWISINIRRWREIVGHYLSNV